MLADTPEFLYQKQIIKTRGVGNTAKGVNALAAVNAYADRLTRDWLMKPVPCVIKNTNQLGEVEETEATMPNLYRLRGRALIKELIAADGIRNVDRVRALGMLMLYREDKMVLYGGSGNERYNESDLANDPFFTQNYDERFSNKQFNFDEKEH